MALTWLYLSLHRSWGIVTVRCFEISEIHPCTLAASFLVLKSCFAAFIKDQLAHRARICKRLETSKSDIRCGKGEKERRIRPCYFRLAGCESSLLRE